MTTFIKETAPHIRRKDSAFQMMMDVVIALLPIVILSIVVYKLRALMIIGISSFTMLTSEFVYVGLRNKMPKDGEKHSFKELFNYAYRGHYSLLNVFAPLVSAFIFAMIMPSNATWYSVFIGSLLGIVFGKLVFGGTGANIFNPAAVGMVISKLCFASTYPPIDYSQYSFIDVSIGGTPLTEAGNSLSNAINEYPILDLFFGRIGGTLGEACSLLIIIGALYLLIRRAADFRVMLSYFLSFTGLVLVAGLVIIGVNSHVSYLPFVTFELLTGGFLFGTVFMITDPVTSPITSPGRVMYGVLAGVLTFFIRFFAAIPEGVGFAILIANMCTPVFDNYHWSSQKYTWKKLLIIALLFIVPMAIMIAVLFLNKGGFWYV